MHAALNDNIRIFTGNSTRELAQKICGHLSLPLGQAMVSAFSDGEIRVEIGDNVRGRDVFLAGLLPSFHAEEVCHDGIYLGEGRFIHASPRGVEVSRLDAETWRVSFKGARRFLP